MEAQPIGSFYYGTDAERLAFVPARLFTEFYVTNDPNPSLNDKFYKWNGELWKLINGGGGSGGMEIHGNEYHNPDYATLAMVYPIGSIYMSVNPTNPTSLFGGTWIAFGVGRVLIGIDPSDPDFDTAEEIGGAKAIASDGNNADEAAHTHTYTQVVNHVHIQKLPSSQTGSQASGTRDTSTTGNVNDALSTNNPTGGVASGTTNAGTSHGHEFTGVATSIVQPYQVVYMWKRNA